MYVVRHKISAAIKREIENERIMHKRVCEREGDDHEHQHERKESE